MTLSLSQISAAAADAARRIAPAWPLEATVAVNPFLGHTGETLAETAARLARTGGVPVTMRRDWYLERIADGRIGEDDLCAALAACRYSGEPRRDVEALLMAAALPQPAPSPLPTLADLAAELTGTDWPAFLEDRIGLWAAGHFDRGQALWGERQEEREWASWRHWATHDLTPEVHGLTGFAAFAAGLPDDPAEALVQGCAALQAPAAALPTLFHRLLFSLGGWAQHARYLVWQAEQAGGTSPALTDLLAVRLAWEQALLIRFPALAPRWAAVVAAHAAPLTPDAGQIVDAILQDAADRAAQRALADTLAAPVAAPGATGPGPERPVVQAVFCIDVRSEVFRRALEQADPGICTLGFAGFFGIGAGHQGFASDVMEHRLPVLLPPMVKSCSGGHGPQAEQADFAARCRSRAVRAWGRFKLAAVSSFAFVESAGPLYAVKLLRDALGLGSAAPAIAPAPHLHPQPSPDQAVSMAERVLRGMSLTSGFARIVLLAGHGAHVTNNPHASALNCGACGGHAGDVNARLLAALLNDPAVRTGLVARGITLPADTCFVAALHDTTSDTVTLYADALPASHAADLAALKRALEQAGTTARAERARLLPGGGSGSALRRRGRNWAEVRPEWGLAGCSAFIAAPRARTAGRSLNGRAFLHDYDWRQDAAQGYPVLELILTAPVVVASWISLQYYGSAVAPQHFGAGNKLLHNVVGGIGVVEGNGGLLRAGLTWQSVQDGTTLRHEPLRLTVCVEAPEAAMTAILQRHDGVRALFDNGWLHLFALDAAGQMTRRYAGDLRWTDCATAPQPGRVAA